MSEFAGVMSAVAAGGSSDTAPAGSPPVASSDPAGTRVPSAESPALAAAPEPTNAPAAPTVETQAVPYVRFKEVNDERGRYKADLDRLAWAQQIQADHAPVITEFYHRFTRDPIGTLIREAESIAQASPEQAQALRSAAARWMGSARGQAARHEPMPEPDYQTADGQPFYSAAQQQKLIEWREQRLASKVTSELQPLRRFMAQQQVESTRAQIASEAQTWAQQQFATWSKRPHFLDHRQDIVTLMESGMGVADAYAEVLATKVLPRLGAQERAGVVATMHAKAEAGTVSPSRGPAHGQPKPKDFREALRQLTSAS